MSRKGGSPDKQVTLRDHLLELRNRLFLVVGVLIVAASLAYVFREPIISALMAPLDGRQLQYLTPGGGFMFIFNVAFFAGLAVTIPVLLQQIYAFLAPALTERFRRRSAALMFWSLVLLLIGVAFGYIYAVPGALNFLYGFADEFIVSALTAESFLDFVVKYTLGLGLIFQIPLVMMIIHWVKPLKPLKLLTFERWVILLAFILAAIITPTPDPINQAIVAVPIIAVYQIGLIAVCMSIWQSNRAVRKVRRNGRKDARLSAKQEKKLARTRKSQLVMQPVAKTAPTSTAAMLIEPAMPEPLLLPAVPRAPQRSIDGMIVRPVASQHSRSRVITPSQAPVAVPTREVPTVPRAVVPRQRPQRPMYLDGMSPIAST